MKLIAVIGALGATLIPVLMLSGFQSDSKFPPYVKDKELYAQNDLRGKKIGPLKFGNPISGTTISPSMLKGRVLLIDFWATWCGPCREVIPELNEWQSKFRAELVVVGISDEPEKTLVDFIAKTKMGYSITSDSAKTLSKLFGVKGIPHAVVVTQDGVVRYQGFPLDEKDKLTTEKLAQIIAANRTLKSIY